MQHNKSSNSIHYPQQYIADRRGRLNEGHTMYGLRTNAHTK